MSHDPEEKFAAAEATSPPASIAGVETRRPGYSIYVWLSGDKLECRCSYVPHDQGDMISRDELNALLKISGVREGFLEEALEDFIAKATAGQPLSMLLLASGTAAVAGMDGVLIYTAPPSVVATHVVDESTDVDMHNVQTFINVMPKDEIGRIVPADPGVPGRTVTGVTIPAKPGKPLNLAVGKNIEVQADGLLIATAAGRVCVVSHEISVAQQYVVSGDVNFRVGSVVFNGFVEVRGDILDGFNVTAVKGLRVNGNIGACHIKSDGDITFCGMDGQEKGTIECGGALTANFIHEATVTAAGSVNVAVELHNCHINTLGRIVVNRGAIVGGSYTALAGIETRKAGSASSVKTMLRAGFDYRDIPELERVSAELDTINSLLAQESSLGKSDRLRTLQTELSEELKTIYQHSHEFSNPKLNVTSILYDNTFLRLGKSGKQKLDERTGPFSVIENSVEGGLRFLPLTSLDLHAQDIETSRVKDVP
ncbi:MAG TPA: DUF342 domain-containing protein [Desulfuromonadales bacterium]|nr:DUF342 domain-containing protein [Desulfuromonadales bacterium]